MRVVVVIQRLAFFVHAVLDDPQGDDSLKKHVAQKRQKYG
jgi:hypothetical protein